MVAAPPVAVPAIGVRRRQPWQYHFPSLDPLYGACGMFSKSRAEVSDQKFLMVVFAPGEVDPAVRCSSLSTGMLGMGNTALYDIGKDLAFAFSSAVPFCFNTRQANAWLGYGGGLELLNEL